MSLDKRARMEELARRLRGLADARVNDAVKLAFLEKERVDEIDALDLTALTEFKRGANGGVELGLIDRMEVLERMAALLGGAEERAEALLLAMGRGEEDE